MTTKKRAPVVTSAELERGLSISLDKQATEVLAIKPAVRR